MSNILQEPEPIEFSHLGNFEARMLRNFQAAVENWDEVCAALGAWEAEHLTRDDVGAGVQQHRRWVTELFQPGDWTRQQRWRTGCFAKAPLGAPCL